MHGNFLDVPNFSNSHISPSQWRNREIIFDTGFLGYLNYTTQLFCKLFPTQLTSIHIWNPTNIIQVSSKWRVFFYLNIGDELIKPVSHVKLLGVLIDDNLSFNEHVSKLCVKAARQTNALCRIVKCIPNECCLDILIYIRHLYPQISTIVILCGIFVAIIALIK